MDSASRIGWKRFSWQSFNSVSGSGRPLRRMQSTENLRNEANGNREYLMTRHASTKQSAETTFTSVTDSQKFNRVDSPCHYPHISHRCDSWCNAEYRSDVLGEGEGEGEDRFPKPMTASLSQSRQLSAWTSYVRKVLREIWLSLILIFLPMLIILTLFAVLVIKYRVKSERGLFAEMLGVGYVQQSAYVLLNIPSSKNAQEMVQGEH